MNLFLYFYPIFSGAFFFGGYAPDCSQLADVQVDHQLRYLFFVRAGGEKKGSRTMVKQNGYPLVMTNIAMENHHF